MPDFGCFSKEFFHGGPGTLTAGLIWTKMEIDWQVVWGQIQRLDCTGSLRSPTDPILLGGEIHA